MTLSASPSSASPSDPDVVVRITYGPVTAQVSEHFQHARSFAQTLLSTCDSIEAKLTESGNEAEKVEH